MAGVINGGCNEKLQNIIDEFPEELLLKIFGFLNRNTTPIKFLTLVNKRWYNILTNDINTMKKLPLTICGDLLRKKHMTIGNWKFYKVIFKSINKSFNSESLSKLKAIGSNVREIKFIDCYVNEPKVFQYILRNFLEVEKITFDKCTFRKRFKKSDTEVLELKNLNELVFKQQNLMVLRCIGAQLKSLKINVPTRFDKYPESLSYRNEIQLMEFLHTQKRLETLALSGIYNSSAVFAKKEKAQYQFKLKELAIHYLGFKEGLEGENLKDFLYSQKDSVEILELGRTFSNDVYELVLKKFENLKTLNIDILYFPTDLSFYNEIKANKNLKQLFIYGEIEDYDQYCTILSLFPKITDIRFTYGINFEVLSCLPNIYNVLTSLSLSNLFPGNYQNLKFSALKNFHLEDIEGGNGWNDLVISNQTIESLSLGRIFETDEYGLEDFCSQLLMVCEVLPNLKHLKLGDNIIVNMFQLQSIVEMCKNLESIKMLLLYDIEMPMRNLFKNYYRRFTDKYDFDPVWKDDVYYSIVSQNEDDLREYSGDSISETNDDSISEIDDENEDDLRECSGDSISETDDDYEYYDNFDYLYIR